MFLVAITEVKGNLQKPELDSLAAELGTIAYELRLLLNAGLPAVVASTADESHGRALLEAITRRGHGAVLCERASVVPSSRMILLRDFALEREVLIADATGGQSCPYEDISVLLRATHRTTSETVEQVSERKLRPVMAIATGGLVMSKTTKKDVVTTTAQREQVLYLFRRSNATPWLLRERAAHYAGLGAAMGPTSSANFATTMARLRALAPNASYDERLVTSRPIRGVADGIEATDLYAHLLAEHLSGRAGGAGG